MAIQFQYNKTSLQTLEKNLKMRVRALPTIKNKESALRMEVKRAKDDIKKLESEIEQRIAAYDKMLALWGEFDTSLLQVEDVKMSIKKMQVCVFLCSTRYCTKQNHSVFSTHPNGMPMDSHS